MASLLNFAVGIANPQAATEADARAIKHQIALENARRAALVPPLPALPDAPAADALASIKTIYAQLIKTAHNDYIRQADEAEFSNEEFKAAFQAATDAQRLAAFNALTS